LGSLLCSVTVVAKHANVHPSVDFPDFPHFPHFHRFSADSTDSTGSTDSTEKVFFVFSFLFLVVVF